MPWCSLATLIQHSVVLKHINTQFMSRTITKPLVIHTLRNTLNPHVVVSSIIAFLPLPDLRGGEKAHCQLQGLLVKQLTHVVNITVRRCNGLLQTVDVAHKTEWSTCLDVSLWKCDHLREDVSHLQVLHLVPLSSSLIKHKDKRMPFKTSHSLQNQFG